eukprot:1156712-Pelagomonas_calceolata.AAC.8
MGQRWLDLRKFALLFLGCNARLSPLRLARSCLTPCTQVICFWNAPSVWQATQGPILSWNLFAWRVAMARAHTCTHTHTRTHTHTHVRTAIPRPESALQLLLSFICEASNNYAPSLCLRFAGAPGCPGEQDTPEASKPGECHRI